MPELPEVEVCRRQLERWASGRTVRAVTVRDAGAIRSHLSSRPSHALPDGAARMAALVGEVAGAPRRRGKRIGWPVGRLGWLVHLGMTGRWVRRPTGREPDRYGRVGLDLDDGHAIWFVDHRRFGCLVPVPLAGLDTQLDAGLGPDALSPPLDGAALAARFAGRRALKVALLDQARVAGLGNIHAAEALWRAGIDPALPCDRLDPPGWERLAHAVTAQLHAAIAETDAEEVRYSTDPGGPRPFAVYGRAGDPCPACGAAVEVERLGGRSTYLCAGCQRGGDGAGRTR